LPDQSPIERRRASRVRSGPQRVQLEAGPTGTLIDLNEFGALLELPAPHDVDSHLTFDLFWEGVPVRLHGRVVRTTPCFDSDARVAWGEPASYHVAVEFFDLADQCAITLHDVVLKLSGRPENVTLSNADPDKG
jgi:hypothetical protein